MNIKKTYVIYLHKNKINNKVYIGQTCQKPEKRWDYGCGYKRHNLHFYNAIQKYGWNNFEHIILEDGLSLEQANEREQYWIKYYNSNQQEKGYNLTAGGDGSRGLVMSEEAKLKIGQANGKLVQCLETGITYYSTMEAARQLNISSSHIGDACHNKRGLAGGYHWEYVIIPLDEKSRNDLIIKKDQLKRCRQSRPIICVETNEIFSGGKEAEEKTGIARGNICSCCKGKRKTAGGYHWKYYGGEQ